MLGFDQSNSFSKGDRSSSVASQEGKVKPSFPGRFEASALSDQCQTLPEGTQVSVAGRVRMIRDLGGVIFAVLSDRRGNIQICITKKCFGNAISTIRQQLSSGCFLGIEGSLCTSRSGERTVDVKQFCLLQAAARPLLQKYVPKNPGKEKERYLEMLMDPEVKKRFEVRSAAVSQVRRYLEESGFCEVETPVLQAGDSGAVAQHFVTHHNFLDLDVYLRITPETYLKQAVIGGLDRVFEIGKVFRNEGRSRQHLQEFTVLECYAAYHDHHDALNMTRKLLRSVVTRAHGAPRFSYQGTILDFDGNWPVLDVSDLVTEQFGIDIRKVRDVTQVAEHANRKHGLFVDTSMSYDRVVESLFRRMVLENLSGPVVVGGYPAGANPLTRKNAADPSILDKFRVIIGGSEVVHICAEEISPVDQKERLDNQKRTRQASEEAMSRSHDAFVEALQYGLPPLAGIGLGIDRLVAILTDRQSLRDVVLFPL